VTKYPKIRNILNFLNMLRPLNYTFKKVDFCVNYILVKIVEQIAWCYTCDTPGLHREFCVPVGKHLNLHVVPMDKCFLMGLQGQPLLEVSAAGPPFIWNSLG
jgi:hypothetical protein